MRTPAGASGRPTGWVGGLGRREAGASAGARRDRRSRYAELDAARAGTYQFRVILHDLIATAGWACLVVGWWHRRDRRRHLSWVLPGMALDLGLVLWLEFTRSVIERTVNEHYGPLQQIHIGTSTAAVVLYIPTIVLGARLALGKGGPATRVWHKRCAVPALVLRTVGFAFMWSV